VFFWKKSEAAIVGASCVLICSVEVWRLEVRVDDLCNVWIKQTDA
jgi:hypothetical protein